MTYLSVFLYLHRSAGEGSRGGAQSILFPAPVSSAASLWRAKFPLVGVETGFGGQGQVVREGSGEG